MKETSFLIKASIFKNKLFLQELNSNHTYVIDLDNLIEPRPDNKIFSREMLYKSITLSNTNNIDLNKVDKKSYWIGKKSFWKQTNDKKSQFEKSYWKQLAKNKKSLQEPRILTSIRFTKEIDNQ